MRHIITIEYDSKERKYIADVGDEEIPFEGALTCCASVIFSLYSKNDFEHFVNNIVVPIGVACKFSPNAFEPVEIRKENKNEVSTTAAQN